MPNPKVLGSLIVPYETHQEYFILKSKEILFFNISIDKSPDNVKPLTSILRQEFFQKLKIYLLFLFTKKIPGKKKYSCLYTEKTGIKQALKEIF